MKRSIRKSDPDFRRRCAEIAVDRPAVTSEIQSVIARLDRSMLDEDVKAEIRGCLDTCLSAVLRIAKPLPRVVGTDNGESGESRVGGAT